MIKNHLRRLYNTISSRGYFEIESLVFEPEFVEGRLRFYDGSLLEFDELLIVRNDEVHKIRYSYHYQDSNEKLIFRYDNAPHFRHIITYPHHKHIGGEEDQVVPSSPPDLDVVLREIESLLF